MKGTIFEKKGNCKHGHGSLCRMLHCMIWKAKKMCWNCTICVLIVYVTAKNTTPLHQSSFNCKVVNLKLKGLKISLGPKQLPIKFSKPAVFLEAPVLGMAVGAEIKNPQVGQATANILKTISGGQILPSTDMHRIGLRFRVFRIFSNKNVY